MKLRIVVAPSLWQALASGCTAISILVALASSINAAPLEYRLLFGQRVHLQLISDRADIALWAGAMVLLTLVLASWRHYGWRAVVLAAAASLPPILANAVSWLPEDPLIVAGAAMMLLLIWRLAASDRRFLRSTWFCLAGLLIMIEVLALGHWLIFPFYEKLANPAAAFETSLTYSGYALVVPLYIVLVLSWIPLLLPEAALKIPKGFFKTALERISLIGGASGASKRLKVGLGSAALAASVLIGYFPYLRTTSRLVGGDIDCCYMPTLLGVLANGPGAVQGSDRVFFYSLLYATHLTTGASAFTILMILPAVLAVLTAVATFVMVRLGLQDSLAAISAALVSALSFNTTAAIFMDLFANWFANVLLLLTIGFLLCAFRGGRRTRLMGVLAIVASVLILFSHALVWWSMIAIVVLFGAAQIVFVRKDQARKLALLVVLLAVNFFVYEVRLAQGITTTVLDTGVLATRYPALAWGLLDGSVYGPFWLNLNYFVQHFGTFYADWPILALAIAGTLLLGLRARKSEREFRLLLGAWMLVGAVLTVTLSNVLSPYYSPTTYSPLVWRGLFMIPIQIPAGISLASLLRSRSGRFAYALSVLALLNYAFRTLALTTG